MKAICVFAGVANIVSLVAIFCFQPENLLAALYCFSTACLCFILAVEAA